MNTPATAPWAHVAFGLDCTESSTVIIKASRTGRTLALESVDMAALATAPSSVIAGSLLQKESFTRWLTAPIASAKKAEKVFPALLDVQLPFSVEDCEYALLETRPTLDRTGTRGLVTGARTIDIEKRLAVFSNFGVNPHLLDQEGLALWSQSLEETPFISGSTDSRLILYLSSERVTLSIGQNGEFLGAHTMRQLDAEQIHRILKSYFPAPPPVTQWFITGPNAILQETGGSPLESLSKRWPGPIKVTRDPKTFLARALAIRALTPGALRCNLRTSRFLHPALAQRQAKRPYQWAAACLAAGLLLCTVNLVWLSFVSHHTAQIQKTFRSLAIEITGSPLGIPAGQEVLSARRALEAQTKAMEPFLAATDTPIAQTLKSILVVAREEGLSIETLTLSRKNMVIHGVAPKWSQAETASRRLNTLGFVATLERKDAPAGEERIAFVIGLGRPHENK
jgi:hypothetical protein